MGKIVYWLIIQLYGFLIRLAAPFNPKAKLWIKGRKNLFCNLKKSLQNVSAPIAWFHCSSLGEFEQARPVIEQFRETFPQFKILLTFFSPSGFEAKKNTSIADWVTYLPLDTPLNARKFVKIVNPKIALFVKYDFWYFILHNLHKKHVPTILFSAIFRKKQFFFSPFGSWYRKILYFFDYIFVQDQKSVELLNQFNIKNVTLAGDTRFDRVVKIARSPAIFPKIQKFSENSFTLVAGSTWNDDHKIILEAFKNFSDLKLIIAPHEISKSKLSKLFNLLTDFNYVTYTQLQQMQNLPQNCKIIVIDTIGILSKLYRFGTVAYIGGGFGAGIHNVLEAAVYGKPTIFGPNYTKSKEATDLINLGSAFYIKNSQELTNLLQKLSTDSKLLEKLSQTARNYVLSKYGATEKIISWIKQNIILRETEPL